MRTEENGKDDKIKNVRFEINNSDERRRRRASTRHVGQMWGGERRYERRQEAERELGPGMTAAEFDRSD